LVLSRHYGLSTVDRKQLNAEHHDLLSIVEEATGFRAKLDRMTRLNLGEGKKVDSRKTASLDIEALKRACQSDISQTYRLYLKWRDGSLQFPTGMTRDDDIYDYDACLIHSHLPPGRYIMLDTNDMTEGQLAEYLAGTWGINEDGEFVEM
jgi:hypothetical protein